MRVDGGASGRRRQPCSLTRRRCRLTRLAAAAVWHRNRNFSLAFAHDLRRVTMMPARTAPAVGRRDSRQGGTERMTKRITMAAATVGHAEGGTPLNAFDNALLAAGIGNINLVKISSILLPDVPVVDLPQPKPGPLTPPAPGASSGDRPGEPPAAAVGSAVPDDPAKNGVIMEFHGHGTRAEPEQAIQAMLEEAFRVRGEPIREMKVVAVEHTVERIGCALAAMTLLGEEDLV